MQTALESTKDLNKQQQQICDEPSQFTEGERPRPQGSSPVEEFPETGKYTDSDKECEAEHDPHHKSGSGKKSKKSGLGSMFEKRSTPKMSKLKEVHSPESGVIVKTAQDGCAEGLVYGGGGKDGIFIKEVVPESPASKSLKLKEGDQILSATVYFDNVSYEDAIQILEHAQAYKVKLCLKRKPDITETEPAIESDVIPEDDLYAPELREKGKTKRRGDARISWPKFPSFGKGRKSRFTRSHSSSEADEQRKLELSPTTSDTESPIKSQDAVKDKKKHKLKLSMLTKRGRISSTEDQDTDTPTTGQISGKSLQTHDTSDMLSPELLESPSGETPKVHVEEDQTEPQTQHKVELITLDNTLKTEDLTVALADKESSPGIKSPDGKKKKKERSELKMKILGKDKHKKDTKAKSPKRLKTLGASIEIPDQPDNEKSDVIPSLEAHTKQGDQLALNAKSQIISNEGSKVKSVTTKMEISVPKVELDISDVALICKSPQKGEEKMTKGKDIKQKEETKISATFKLPKTDFGDITAEETVQKVTVKAEESTTKSEQLPTDGTKVKEDPYEQLSKRSLSRTQLPKREEIEIPGMEDMSMRITAKGIKEPKAGFTGRHEEIKAETSPMSIDVDSVKEAVSKLPGFKLPKVDTSGVPIPEEIIVIDANAQRISVKTPTKVVDTKTKHEAHFTKYDITASPEISKTTVKLPKITPADMTSEELLTETKVDLKKKSKAKQSDGDIKTEDYKREDIIIPGKESAQEGAIHQAQDTVNIQGTAGIKFEYESAVTLSPRESDKKTKKARITMPSFGIARQDIKIPDIGMDFPEQDDTLKGERTIFLQDVKAETGELISDAKTAETDEFEYIDSVSGSDIKYVEADDQTNKLLKFGTVTAGMDLNVPDVEKDVNIDGAEIKTFEGEGKGSKFKMPNLAISMPRVKGPKIDLSLSKKDVDVTLPQAKAEVKLQEVPEVDVTIGHVDVSIPEQRFEVEKPEVEIQPLMTEGERDGQGGKFRMPKLGITMPKVKGPDVDLSFSKKAGDVPEAKANIKIPEQPESEAEMDVQGSRFKMPKFGISMPKVKGPEIDFSLSKKDVDVSLPEAKAEVRLPDVEDVDIKAPSVDIEGPSIDVKTTAAELDGKGSKFKMPKFGISLPKVKGSEIDLSLSKKNVDVTLPKAKAEVKLPDIEGTGPGVKVEVKPPEIAIHQQDVAEVKLPEAPKVDVSIGKAEKKLEVTKPELEIKPLQGEVELDGQGGKFKMPKLGMSMPKVKGPEIHFGMSKKDRDVTLPEAKAEVKVPEVELKEPSAKVEIKAPEIKVAAKGIEGSPSKFKMPTFKLPKFGVGTPNISVNLPDTDKDVKTGEADINIPEEECVLNIAAPSTDIECPSIDMKTTGTEQDGKGSKFKMPHLGFSMPKVKGPKIDVSLSKKDTDVTLPEVKADVKLPEVDLGKVDVSIPDAKIEVPESKAEIQLPEAPKIAVEIKPLESEAEMDVHGGRFKLPKFGVKMPKVKGPEFDLSLSKKDVDVKLPETKVEPKIDVSLGKAEVQIPEAKAEIKKPEVQIKSLQTDNELDGHGGKFKMPKFGITMPKGPEIDLSFSKKDVDVTLPEAKAEVELPEAPKVAMDIKLPVCETEIDGQGSKFKMPKFGISMPKVKGPEFDLSFSKKDVDVTLPEAKAEVELPEAPKVAMDIKPPVCETEIDGQGSKFKMPKFGITMPKITGPDIDLSLSKKDVDVTLPEAKAEVKLPDVELKEHSVKVEINAPETEAQLGQKGSPSKFKMPTFKFPKFGVATPSVSVEAPDDKGIKIDGADMKISVPHTDIDVPEVKAQVHLPELEVKEPSGGVVVDLQPDVEVDTKVKKPKFSMPRFSFSKPSIKSPEVDVSLPEVDAAIPEGKVEVKGGEVDVNLPECEAEIDGQGSKFKMPKFGITMPKITGPDIDLSLSKKDVDVTLPEVQAEVKLPDVELKEPSAEVEIKAPDIKVGTKVTDGSPSKFKMPTFKLPKFGIGSPSVTMEVPDVDRSLNVEVPDIDKGIKIDGADMKISVPHTDIDVPEVKAQVHLPELEVKEPSGGVVVDLQPDVDVDTKVKKPKFSMPKFSFSKPSIKSPEVDVSLPDLDAAIPEGKIEVKGGEVDVNLPECEAEIDGQGRKFKMPKFGITMPKITGPDIDLSLSKKDVDVTLPEAKAEVKLPDVELKEPSAEVEIKAPDIKVGTKDKDGSPSKFKMPTFKLPKFGTGSPSAIVEVPDVDKDVKIDGADMKIPEEVLRVEIAAPSIDTEGPSIDIKTTGPEYEGKGSKFKMPSLGFSVPQVKGPNIDLSLSKKDVDVTLPEARAEVQLPDVELKESSAKMEIKAPGIDVETSNIEGSPSKFKMPTFKLPKFGVATPQVSVEGPDVDIEVDGADLKLPKTKAEVKLPDVEIKEPVAAISVQPAPVTEGDAKLKKPRFSLPKFSFSKQSTKEPGVDVSLPDVDVSLPEVKVEVKQPEVELKSPEVDVELDGQGSKFKMPKFGITMPKVKGPEIDLSLSKKDVDVKLPEAKAEVQLPDVKIKQSSAKVEIKGPEIKGQAGTLEGSPSKLKMPTFTLPKFGSTTPKVSGEVPDVDIDIDGAKLEVPKEGAKVDITAPSIDTEGLSVDVKAKGSEGSGSKFKMPKFGISMPKVKGPDIDLSLSKKDVDVTLPEAKAEVTLPDVELKEPSAEVEIKAPDIKVGTKDTDGSPSKFKMPTFKFPKFGTGSPSAIVEVPDVDKDVKIDGADMKTPEEVLRVEIAAPSIDTEGPSIDIKTTGPEYEGKGSKFKMPSLGFSVPQVKGPNIDLSLSKKDVDVTLPEARAEVQLPDVELKESFAKMEIKTPGIDVETSNIEGSPSKFKMSTFKLPKFGAATPQVSVEGPDVDIEVDGADLKLPKTKAEVKLPDVEIKEPVAAISVQPTPVTEGDAKLKKTRFSLPKFSFSKQSTREPGVDVSLPDVDVSLPEGKVEVKQPEVELKSPEVDVELDGRGSKFKMPKFGITMPKITGPDIDLSLSKKDVDVTLPEAKAEVKLPDVELKEPSAEVEIKAPDIKVGTKDTDGSPSKFKMPTFKLPKFGIGSPSVTMEVPDVDKSVSVEAPDIDKGIKIDGADMKISVPHTDIDIDVPEVKAQVHLPELEVKEPSGGVVVDLQPDVEVDTKVKKPKFSMPKFSFSKPSIKSPEVDVSLPDVDAAIPEGKIEVKGGEVDVNLPECEAEIDGQGSKFKMPKFGITMPKITGPDIDLSLSKKDVDVTLPEAKAEVKLPDVELKEPSAEVEIKAPDIKVGTKDKDGSPSKFKMPTFKLPKFGTGSPSAIVEVPDVDKDVKIDGADMKIPEEVLRVEIAAPSIDTEGPSIDIKTTGPEYEGKGSKFKMPSLGFSVPQVKGPNIDLSLSKKDVDVTLPEARAEVQLPDVELKESSAKMEIKAPGIDVETSNIEGSPSKFKMPTFKLPKFGAATPQVSVEGPDVDIEVDGADLKLPKTKAEVKLPNVEIKEPVAAISVQPAPVTEGDAKLKKPRFSLPKFSFSKQSTKEPGVDVSLPDVDVSLPEGKVEVKQPEVELKSPEVDVELDGQGSKFKMPKFGITMPKVKGPEIDLSLSKKDVDVTVPEAKAEVQLPDVKSSAKVEIKGPEIKAQAGTLEGSPSKLKMPTFTLPKFAASTPKISVEVPDVDKDINIDGTKGVKVDVTAPSIDTEGLSVDVKAEGREGSGSKFKMPNLAISMPKVKGPEVDLSLSKKDVDVTLPEAEAEVQLPDVQVKEPEGAISVPDAPTVEVEAKLKRSNWTFPKFSFSKTGGKVPDVDVNLETPKVDVTSPEVKAEVCLPEVEVQGPSVAVSMEEPPAAELDANLKKAKFSLPKFSFSKSSMKEPDVSAVDVSLPEGEVIVKQPEIEVKAPKLEAEHDEQGNKFKLPKFGITLPKVKGAEGDLSPSQKDVDITLPEVKAEVKLPETEVKSTADVEIKSSETEAKLKDVGGSPLKFKKPTMKLPKFGAATYEVTVEAPDADKLVETDGTKLKEDVNVINIKSPIVDIKTDVSKAAITDADTPKTETEGLGSPSKFKLPLFKMPRLSFSKTKPEGEYVPVETECKEDKLEMEVELKGESKQQKTSLTSFGEILKTIDVEFDVPKTDENLETSKEVKETDEPSGKQLEPKEKQTNIKQETTKSPERTGWFKFPKFGLSSPSEPAKSSEKERLDEELSPTCSVQSSDAFADISSAMTSEHVGPSLSSPTKVTVKYSDPDTASGLGETHSNIITSTTRTELISVEPNLPEKITILSSGVSSSSEDTLRLESGKIHVITSNIQATPESQHAKLLTAIQVQSAEGPLLKSEANEASSWTFEESRGGRRTIFERRSVRETSSEISESKETIVITKQITRMSEPISGETASSIQRLRDSVHSDKMRFFDGAEK
ncbi:Neuroblast differentiation-associated protein AHNAK [Collichthys lucidus]|uniref:Neuroblast differentiation-associated protein AHNAK n=1 Tax=Collichthys lucidus TaxID=240159 RepID=A0A4U5VGH3_COLLU|nr:Neuroblast differentiation-associated protein AHNAK [Collichthys lucidus]